MLRRKYDGVAGDYDARAGQLVNALDEALAEARRAG